jgi:hypothetical protein
LKRLALFTPAGSAGVGNVREARSSIPGWLRRLVHGAADRP